MKAIEENNNKMEGVLPKEVYGQLVPEGAARLHFLFVSKGL